MTRAKVPTQKEKIAIYERLLHDIHFHRTVTMNEKAVIALLDKISRWSGAHSTGNGERDEKTIDNYVNQATWELDKR